MSKIAEIASDNGTLAWLTVVVVGSSVVVVVVEVVVVDVVGSGIISSIQSMYRETGT